jgi:hypothetical protein
MSVAQRTDLLFRGVRSDPEHLVVGSDAGIEQVKELGTAGGSSTGTRTLPGRPGAWRHEGTGASPLGQRATGMRRHRRKEPAGGRTDTLPGFDESEVTFRNRSLSEPRRAPPSGTRLTSSTQTLPPRLPSGPGPSLRNRAAPN